MCIILLPLFYELIISRQKSIYGSDRPNLCVKLQCKSIYELANTWLFCNYICVLKCFLGSACDIFQMDAGLFVLTFFKGGEWMLEFMLLNRIFFKSDPDKTQSVSSFFNAECIIWSIFAENIYRSY